MTIREALRTAAVIIEDGSHDATHSAGVLRDLADHPDDLEDYQEYVDTLDDYWSAKARQMMGAV